MKIRFKLFYSFLLLFIALFYGLPQVLAADAWYNTSWNNRVKITFNNAAQAENLTNFPVLVTLSSSNISYASTQNAGQDIRFTDSDGTTLLSYEIEKWDESGSSFVWTKIPQIDASSSTDYIYMYYGNSSAADAQDKTAVWSTYAAVYHLSETGNGTTDEFRDSSTNSYDGTGGAGTSANAPSLNTSGKIGNAETFDGTDFIDMGNVLNLNSSFTLSSWIYCTVDQTGSIINKRNASSNATGQWSLLTFNGCSTGTARLFIRNITPNANIQRDSIANLTIGTWIHITGVLDITGQTMNMYINGQLNNGTYSGGTITNINQTTTPTRIGADSAGLAGRFFIGHIDETRISTSVKSAAWIAADYKSETNTFNTYATTESLTTSPPEPDSPIEILANNTTSTPQCDKNPPGVSAPLLWGATAKDKSSILLQFGAASDPVDHYALLYGTKAGIYTYGATDIGDASTRAYIVKSLAPNTRYWFRVRAGNGCAPGAWSNEMSATTEPLISGRLTPKPVVQPTNNATEISEPTQEPPQSNTLPPSNNLTLSILLIIFAFLCAVAASLLAYKKFKR